MEKRKTPLHPQLRKSPSKEGWPDIRDEANSPLKHAFRSFENALPIDYPPGTVLYRVIDPASFDNSANWMSKVEFDALNTKASGAAALRCGKAGTATEEYVTYTVPPGERLRAWEGVTASQEMKGSQYILAGGARQIVVDPKDLDKAFVGKRQPTGWGYGDSGESLHRNAIGRG